METEIFLVQDSEIRRLTAAIAEGRRRLIARLANLTKRSWLANNHSIKTKYLIKSRSNRPQHD